MYLKLVVLFQKKILKLQNFVSGVPLPFFQKNARILMVIFIGHRQLNNIYFHLPLLHTRYTFCSSNLYTKKQRFKHRRLLVYIYYLRY
jgi:coproporphyrinogen III oxidase-like Fe-S oxidoreductase